MFGLKIFKTTYFFQRFFLFFTNEKKINLHILNGQVFVNDLQVSPQGTDTVGQKKCDHLLLENVIKTSLEQS